MWLGVPFLEPFALAVALSVMIPSLNVKKSVPTLSALQLVKEVKKDEERFVAQHLLNPLFSGERVSSLDSEARVSLLVVILIGWRSPGVVQKESGRKSHLVPRWSIIPTVI